MTVHQAAMAEMATRAAPALRAAGFRKRRNSFNRTTSAGLTHVVSYQLGQYDPSGTRAQIAWLPDLFGKFTVNVGVYAPELSQPLERPRGPWVNEFNCTLRKRIGMFQPAPDDTWWVVTDQAGENLAMALVFEAALPFLSRFETTEQIVNAFETVGPVLLGMGHRTRLEIGAWYLASGNGDRAREHFQIYVDRLLAAEKPVRHHWPIAAAFIRDHGFPDLAERLSREALSPPAPPTP